MRCIPAIRPLMSLLEWHYSRRRGATPKTPPDETTASGLFEPAEGRLAYSLRDEPPEQTRDMPRKEDKMRRILYFGGTRFLVAQNRVDEVPLIVACHLLGGETRCASNGT
jgi:hypothetical protein